MNAIIFGAREAQLIFKGQIDQQGLEEMRKDTARQFAIKAQEAYLIYDEQGGITVVLVLPEHDGRNN